MASSARTTCGVTDLLGLDYRLIRNNSRGMLTRTAFIDTGILGHSAALTKGELHCALSENGTLTVFAYSIWDFGSGPAINTPAMVRASLPHDALCLLTNHRLVPWSVRRKADSLFRKHLKALSPPRKWYNPLRYHANWRWLSVSLYSQLIARWRDKR